MGKKAEPKHWAESLYFLFPLFFHFILRLGIL